MPWRPKGHPNRRSMILPNLPLLLACRPPSVSLKRSQGMPESQVSRKVSRDWWSYSMQFRYGFDLCVSMCSQCLSMATENIPKCGRRRGIMQTHRGANRDAAEGDCGRSVALSAYARAYQASIRVCHHCCDLYKCLTCNKACGLNLARRWRR